MRAGRKKRKISLHTEKERAVEALKSATKKCTPNFAKLAENLQGLAEMDRLWQIECKGWQRRREKYSGSKNCFNVS